MESHLHREPAGAKERASRRRALRRQIGLVLLAYITLALAYSVVNPLYEATDELRHYRFVRVVATTGRLPVQGQEPCRSQSHHPPLFYALGAALTAWIDTGRDVCFTPEANPFWAYRYWEVGRDNKTQYLHGADEAFPWRGDALAAHLVRALNVLLGAGVVALTWASGRLVWPRRPGIALGAAALVAFNPMFLYLAAAINNDVIAALSGAAVVYGCLRLLRDPAGLHWRWGVVLGALFGLALLSKFNLSAVIVLIEAAVTWVAWRRGQWRQWLIVNGLLVAVAAAAAGWWFVRNVRLYGEPTGFQEVTELWGVRDPRQSVGLALSELPYAWTTLWGRFGFGQIPLPDAIYAGLVALVGVGLLGAAAGFWGRANGVERAALLLLAAQVALFFAVLFNYMLVSPAGPNGRFFFPALSALALLVAYGLAVVLDAGRATAARRGRGPARFAALVKRGTAPILLAAALLGLALLALIGYLAPAYAAPPDLPPGAAIPNPSNARFDTLATLLGYEVSPGTVRPGEPLDIQLYWQVENRPPGNYLLFVHLVDENGAVIAQRDTHPGLGNFPASQWAPGDRFVDAVRLHLPETAYAPAAASLRVGLYAPDGYRLAISAADGSPLGDALGLAQVQVAARPGEYPNPQQQNFGDQLELVGYAYDRRSLAPGETLSVTLYWRALGEAAGMQPVQMTLTGPDGAVAAEVRAPAGESWPVGDVRPVVYALALDPAAPPGRYAVDLAVLDPATGARLFIVAADGHYVDDQLPLAELVVRPAS